jgi:hypothetical protein
VVSGVNDFRVERTAGAGGSMCDPCSDVSWAYAYGLEGHSQGRAIEFNDVGELFVAGIANAAIDFGPGALPIDSQYGSVIAKLGSDAGIWSGVLNGTQDEMVTSMALDPEDNPVIVGYFDEQLVFGDQTLNSPVDEDADGFVMELPSAGGKPPWFQHVGVTSQQIVGSVAVDALGNTWFGGSFHDMADVAGTQVFAIIPGAQWDALLGKLDPLGNPLWLRGWGDAFDDNTVALCVDGQNNGLVAISFAGNLDVGTGVYTAVDVDVLVVELNATGEPRWATQVSGAGDLRVHGMACDPSGGVALFGTYQGVLDVGGESLPDSGSITGYLVRLDASGTTTSVRIYPGVVDPATVGRPVAFDVDGNLLLTGSFQGSVDFGGGALESVVIPGTGGPSWDVFVAQLDPAGEHLYSKAFGSIGRDVGLAVAGDPSRHIVATGEFEGKIELGDHTLTSVGNATMFVVELAP